MWAFWAVYKRELSLFFRSNIVYAIAGGWLLFMGVVYSASIAQFVSINQSGFASSFFVADDVIIGHLGTWTFLLFLTAPLLTMRLLAEEAREGTLEVLMTLPIADASFVLGKFFAVWTVYTLILALTGVHVMMVTQIGNPDMGLIASAYLGAWLYGGAVLSIALIWSAVAEDQIVAAFLGSASILILFLADGVALIASSNANTLGVAEFIRELSLQTHYQQTFLLGIIRAEDIVYFIFLMLIALFLTTLIVGSRRWRAS